MILILCFLPLRQQFRDIQSFLYSGCRWRGCNYRFLCPQEESSREWQLMSDLSGPVQTEHVFVIPIGEKPGLKFHVIIGTRWTVYD